MERVVSSCASLLLLAQRRGYSVAAAVVRGSGRKAAEKVAKRIMGKDVKMNSTAASESAEKTPWVPDPVTGYYRPSGGANKEMDAAELRARLLTRRREAN